MVRMPDWIYRQSAVLPYRRRGPGLEVLLITSRKGKRWVLPKGIVEPGLSGQASAAKEAAEEAGVEGEVAIRKLGRYRYEKWDGTCRVEVFPMRVTVERREWPEAAIRRREWLSPEAAAARLREKKLRKLVLGLPQWLEGSSDKDAKPATIPARPPHMIYLFRHAEAAPPEPGQEDFDRPLSGQGRCDAEAMQPYLSLGDLRPDLVLCSSARRARQTLAKVRPAIGEDVPVKHDRRLYKADVAAWLTRLRRLPEATRSVMAVGHNPTFHALANELADGGDAEALTRLKRKLPAGGLAALVLRCDRWRDLGPGTCELHSLVAPADLA